MAEGWGKKLAGANWEVFSAGAVPLGHVSPESVEAMKLHGIDISEQYSKGLDEIPLDELDVFVGMGCGPASEVVPAGFQGLTFDWNIPDPYRLGQGAFDQVCLLLQDQIKQLFATLAEQNS